ncbi:TERF1-interacting nuclear factor 2 isoform X3 [Boleophthalmus pectinirostris]|uniref:TERF1-interacting nuclear factor 2 isoform X3 n=1 Tax=Boleophthalmus pectinirostris TaxID=150288 RepID=UPI00242DE236|nr:TERF1-interacting nuclear factor 2 isoform X3 [Boleophthalmus pectinirostris]
MAARMPKANVACTGESSLPLPALKLLAPPVRLVSAALWKVMKERDVMQYGIVEEFVTSACDTVPGLLTLKHQAKLTLGLRARLILELCKQPDPETIAEHMKRIQVPVLHSSSAVNKERDIRIQDAVRDFHSLVPVLLTDKVMRTSFFKERFPVDFGPRYDQELEKLLWEFLIRLDQLLPVPNLAQTVSWLSEAPPVLEECAQASTQPQLLKVLLQHQSCLGHLETADDNSLCAIWVSCLKRQPKVKVERLQLCCASHQDQNLTKQRCVSPVTIKHNSVSTRTQRNKASTSGSDDKE